MRTTLALLMLMAAACAPKKQPAAMTASNNTSAPTTQQAGEPATTADPMPAPDGYTWLACEEELSCFFLVPDGWHTRQETTSGTTAIHITKEPIEPPNMRFETGVSIQIIRDVRAKTKVTPSDYGDGFLMAARERGTPEMEMLYSESGPLKGLVTRVVISGPEPSLPDLRLQYLVFANDTTDTLYLTWFESPVDVWDEHWPIAQPILDVVALSPKD